MNFDIGVPHFGDMRIGPPNRGQRFRRELIFGDIILAAHLVPHRLLLS